MNNQIKDGLTGVLVGGVAIGLFKSPIVTFRQLGMMNSSPSNVSTIQNTNGLDAHFIEEMVPHHEDAITMAKIAQIKAKHPEVKDLANRIIDTQGKEIVQMQLWYRDWFGKEVQPNNQAPNQHGMLGNNKGLQVGMMGDATDIKNLEQATDFDKAFVEDMIPHHQMAIMMATMLKNGTSRLELVKFADNIITTQTNEITLMRAWIKDW